jgi:hypothetical protein
MEALGTQLEVDGQVLLGNKELSTSAHLRRRMPRQRRTGGKRESLSFNTTSSPSSSDEENVNNKLANRMAALSCE